VFYRRIKYRTESNIGTSSGALIPRIRASTYILLCDKIRVPMLCFDSNTVRPIIPLLCTALVFKKAYIDRMLLGYAVYFFLCAYENSRDRFRLNFHIHVFNKNVRWLPICSSSHMTERSGESILLSKELSQYGMDTEESSRLRASSNLQYSMVFVIIR